MSPRFCGTTFADIHFDLYNIEIMDRKFSLRTNAIMVLCKEEAERLHHSMVMPEDLMLAILRDGNNKAVELLAGMNVDLSILKQQLESLNIENSNVTIDDMLLSSAVNRIIRISMLEARLHKQEEVGPEHLLLAITRENSNGVASLLQQYDIDYKRVVSELLPSDTVSDSLDINDGNDMLDDEEDDGLMSLSGGSNKQQESQKTKKTKNASGTNTPVLDSFTSDLTQAAEEGKLDPVIGRDKEIERLAQILSRRKKNNPILIGEPGVGKSAIVEGLAQRIVQRKVSRILYGKRLLSLDMAAVVAGTKYRGQFEERLRSIMQELKKNPDIIIFIDEVHTIIGAGSAPGSMDAANMLKPALSRGEFQCIGATTVDEYRKTIEKDGALERRFQKVLVEPTSTEETIAILQNIKSYYEDHHNVTYSDDAIIACVKLSDRYISDRSFPDKAIDVMDEAGARTHLFNMSVPKEIEDQEKLIDEARKGKNDAVMRQDFELAAKYRDSEKNLEVQLEQLKKGWEETLKEQREVVTAENIANVVSMISGVPVQKMAQEEGVRIKGLATVLNKKVIAQQQAVDMVAKAIRRSRVGLKNPNKPIGTFLFLGPTGVGKTLLAKELAEQMFGSADALIRIDMSEFMEKFTVSRLVGAPPGYVGYENGGQLTEKVRRKPYSIVLLDEIEKAHQDVFNLLLQVMDEGRLTDSDGRTVDFRNTIIIMTSNIGSRQVKDFGRGVGFSTTDAAQEELAQELIRKALNKSFAPEFINRIDEIITFHQLSKEAISEIVTLEVDKLKNRVTDLGYVLQLDPQVYSFLSDKGYSTEYGARPLKRAIQTYLEDKLSEMLIEEECSLGDTIIVSCNDGKDVNIKIEKRL